MSNSHKHEKIREGKILMQKNKENSKETLGEQEEKRKTLPPLETWLDSDKTAKELHEMGYSYLEMMELGSRLW